MVEFCYHQVTSIYILIKPDASHGGGRRYRDLSNGSVGCVIQLLQKALYPQLQLHKFNEINTCIDGVMTQLTAKDNKIAALEKRVEELEESTDRTEQYSR